MFNKVLARPTSDKNLREYHIIGATISDQPYAEFFRPTWGTEEEFSMLGAVGEKIAWALMSPDYGETIERIVFRPNSIRVSKTPTANWGFLEPNVIKRALEEALGSELEFRQYHRSDLRQMAHA